MELLCVKPQFKSARIPTDPLVSIISLVSIYEFMDGQNLATKLSIILLNKISINIYFENLTVELHILYTFNIYVKFYVN